MPTSILLIADTYLPRRARALAKGREQRCAQLYPDEDVLVFGHSHIPWDTTAASGHRLQPS